MSKNRRFPDKSIALPIYICHDRKNFDFSKQKSVRRNGSFDSSSIKVSSLKSERRSSIDEVEIRRVQDKSLRRNGVSVYSSSTTSKGMSLNSKKWNSINELEIDEVAVKAVISILNGYIGKFIKDESFRESIREKCYSCLSTKVDSSDNKVIQNIVLAIEKIERLMENTLARDEMKVKSLLNLIKLLNIVASINTPSSKNGSTCGVPNSYLSACAELYLSIVSKLQKKDRVCARHLLQVFCVSPFLARTHLLSDLWERFLLPHLLHIKVWYMEEVEFISESQYVEKERRLKALTKAYNDQIDFGTKQFALYYKEWLKIDAVKVPPIPSVPLPSMSSKSHSERRSSGSYIEQCSINKNLFQTIFGPDYERRSKSVELENGREGGNISNTWHLEEERRIDAHDDKFKQGSSDQTAKWVHSRSSSLKCNSPKIELWPETNKSDYLRIFSCRNEPSNGFVDKSRATQNGASAITREPNNYHHLPSSNFNNAITTICSSDILIDCEVAIRVVAKAWLEKHGNPVVESSLSKACVIEGILEVLFISKDDEILELGISILAELVSRSEVNRQIILNSDPQLEIFLRLLKNSSLFLKSSVLLYLLMPKAKQMLSKDWVPLVLRVLEFGDQLQTLFTIQCRAQVTAYYLLTQLLTGFDVEINLENARKVISLGGLSILVRRLGIGGYDERNNAAFFITSCIQADGSCRHYIANNVKKASILELLVLGKKMEYSTFALSLLIELLCLDRTQVTKFLKGLQTDGGCLNTMHILFVYLQHAPLEQRPLVAAILLQLDLLGDYLQSSVYREELVDAIVEALDCKKSNKKVQEQSGRALLLLGGRFTFVGKASVENWLLKQAGFDESSGDLFYADKEMIVDANLQWNEEGEATESWLRKAALVLLRNGNKRLLTALSESIENGIPCLSRASLVTVAWMSNSLHTIQDVSLQSLACSILAPQLLETLNYDRQLEERVLASLSLLSLIKNSGCQSMFANVDKDFVSCLRNLSLVTWTAEELLSIVTTGSKPWYSEQEIVPFKNETIGFLE
ncbi:Transducin/WD40 repeat-like superfamily protein [Thalictrum thalictroides]|uniref:Transducin/WD40 repeat-like superfamily protein n=1 Tax=Thalictrum thalictroides TaxID=46969 RepID=A0A7J6VRE5_THATH|nr:Transducin/WD40 repeat-like superfamily protein [Thalictrum thalictroides]